MIDVGVSEFGCCFWFVVVFVVVFFGDELFDVFFESV